MQLYSVKFRHHKERTIDFGEVIVMASSNETASDQVLMRLDLPRSSTTTEVMRLKPNMFQVMRGEMPKERPINGTFPRSQAELDRLLEPERERFSVQISGFAWAHSEDNAVKKIAKAALAEAEGRDPSGKAVSDLQIFADKQEAAPRSPAIEQNSIFTHMKMFQGGAVRPR
ncbi:hypothetical protein [Bradyrhizobium sp. Tv2a-2]|uniref:hypothetical protein n=1 Tax=Bradyrhizobium sp. Tv2a-2 TaxID=113395 RepID=UPI0004192A31|nr:hypothetical protein [Bradyrhizobium sp. Tv2a-2]